MACSIGSCGRLGLSGLCFAVDKFLIGLYGVSLHEPNPEILMRHRAVQFGLPGLFLIYAAFPPSLQLLAIIAGAASALSFIVIACSVGGYSVAILEFDSMEAIGAAMSSPQGQATAADLANFASAGVDVMMGETRLI